MSIESEFFQRKRPSLSKMRNAGFREEQTEEGRCFIAEEEFGDGQFRAEIRIDGSGEISGRVIDLDTGEDYLPLRAKDSVGEFVGRVREEYMEVLGRIGEAAFVPVAFAGDQANRMAAWMEEEFGAEGEFPWEKYPGNGTFKCKGNGKWFAAILTVAFGKLEKGDDGREGRKRGDPGAGEGRKTGQPVHDPEEIVEVVNLKAAAERIPEMIGEPGVYPAWHMNKTHWISVILDDTLEDGTVKKLIRDSHGLVEGAAGSRPVRSHSWIIPSNPKIYDVDRGFAENGTIDWHQHNDIHAGDEVYIYSSSPNSAIMYRCEVVEADLSYEGMYRGREGYDRAMRLRLVEKYPPDRFPLAFLREHGGSAVRSARRMPEELKKAMEKR